VGQTCQPGFEPPRRRGRADDSTTLSRRDKLGIRGRDHANHTSDRGARRRRGHCGNR
jgi:hypothetical protein